MDEGVGERILKRSFLFLSEIPPEKCWKKSATYV
jgi:hypothetical protein